MGRSCVIVPKVKNKNGQIVESRLFKDLLSYSGYNQSACKHIYETTKSESFIQNWNPILELDENGEPTFKSLLSKTNITKYIPESSILEKLNRKIGYYKRGEKAPSIILPTEENYTKLQAKASEFNNTSEFKDIYQARVVKLYDKESGKDYINVYIDRKDTKYNTDSKKLEYNYTLNQKLKDILISKGISIGALTELERRLGVNGVTDFDAAKTTAEGLIEMIRLAEGEQGQKALPEEFAHFAIEAMGNHPLITRLINHIHSTGLIKEVLGDEFDTYNTLYKGDKYQLAKEVAGKLLAKHLLLAESTEKKSYKNILDRVISAVKEFFGKLKASEIQKAMYEADKDFGNLAKNILNGSLDSSIDVKNINTSKLFYSISERIARDRKLLGDIIENELKRLKIYEKRNPKSKFSTEQKDFIDLLEVKLALNNELDGIYAFIENAVKTLNSVHGKLNSLASSSPGATLNDKASTLRDIRNYIYSYKKMLKFIRKALVEEKKYADNRYEAKLEALLDKSEILINNLTEEYEAQAKPLFAEFLKPFIGSSIAIPFGKDKGKIITVEELIERADEDISMFDRWLDSMADSSDYMLKIFDQAVKKSKENARLNTIEVRKRLEEATIKLERAGVKTTDWMFEKDDEGNLTGNYISEIDYALYRKNKKALYEELERKYGKNPVGEDAVNYRKEKKAWYTANTDTVGKERRPKISIYGSVAFRNLSPVQKEYYDTIMAIKAELDAFLPENATRLTNAVKIRRDLLERVKSSRDVASGAKQIWESVKDEFMRRSDDIDLGHKSILKDFEGHKVQTLPIYYTKLGKDESPNDISTDIVSTLTAYASMANEYDEMGKVIDVLELGRDLMRQRQVIETSGGLHLQENIEVLGRKIESKLTKEGIQSNIMNRLEDFFEMQVYGRYMADEGTFGKTKIDKAKTANVINQLTSLNSLALNILSGISNLLTGKVMMRIESMCGEFFNMKDVTKADLTYSKELPEYLAEIGNRVKTSKLYLFQELFDTLQEYDSDIKNINFDRKTWFSRMFSTNSLFFMNNAGEHWMQNRTALALANSYKMLDSHGKTVSLWDALEVVYIDPSNKALGAKLQIKEGYTKEDGTEFTKEDIIKFSRKSAAINERMHGIYNKADRSAVQRLAVGRMAIMFRKWIKPSLNRRFATASYNYDMEAWTEGYYITAGRFLWQLAKDLRYAELNIGARWKELDKTEKYNIGRAAIEVSHYLILCAFLAFMDWGDDDKRRPWYLKMMEYQARRLRTEIGAMIPGPYIFDEALKILKSPAAGINTMEGLLDLLGLLNPMNYEAFAGEEALLQSGRYKGESKATKLILESPLVPMNKTVYRGLHPETVIPFFKQ